MHCAPLRTILRCTDQCCPGEFCRLLIALAPHRPGDWHKKLVSLPTFRLLFLPFFFILTLGGAPSLKNEGSQGGKPALHIAEFPLFYYPSWIVVPAIFAVFIFVVTDALMHRHEEDDILSRS
ncbi:hypothetical protein F5Y13DRAFT_96073 [Hypoxylon sp. FL1857]|nr:hypothetical protein F5Y13DRAFT_96073 [Hypoxylon sp. FL1857]